MARHSAGGRADLQELPVAIHRDVETEDYTVMLHWNAEDGSIEMCMNKLRSLKSYYSHVVQ